MDLSGLAGADDGQAVAALLGQPVVGDGVIGFDALWMYLTPLFYPETIIPDEFIVAFRLNPMYIFVTLFRDPVLYQKIPDPVLWINGSLYGFGVLILGWWIFTKHSNDFAYRA